MIHFYFIDKKPIGVIFNSFIVPADKMKKIDKTETSKRGHLKRTGQCLTSDVMNGKDLGIKSRNHLNRSAGGEGITKHSKGEKNTKIQKMKKPDHVNLDKENSDNRIIQGGGGRKFKENVCPKFTLNSNKLKPYEVRKNESKFSPSRIPRLSSISRDKKMFYSSTDEDDEKKFKRGKNFFFFLELF